ncbi:MAG: hypothetical protein K2K53_08290 [Oscillospiraceae bacterium]|nr:hypothetical protein [Oscillospiraceae bacterium]
MDRSEEELSGRQTAPTLMEDIPKAAEWFFQAMNASGYPLDGTLESFQELDRFIDEQKRPGGVLGDHVGYTLFAMGSYVGQTLIAQLGGQWETDDEEPEGEINIAVHLDRSTVWPVQRVIKRFMNGPEDSIYTYGIVLKRYSE